MTTLDELVVKIRADAGQFEREMNRVSGAATNATTRMSAGFSTLKGQMLGLIPALSAGAFVAFTKNAVDMASALQDMADRTGASVGLLADLRTEIENAGGSVEQLGQAFVFMNNFLGEAAKGNQQAAETLAQLGTSFEELSNLSPDQQFLKIAEGASNLGTQFERTEALRSVFGRGVANLIPILSQGAEGIEKIREAQQELGSVTDEQAAALDRAGDNWNTFVNTLQNRVAAGVGEAIIFIENLNKKISENEKIFQDSIVYRSNEFKKWEQASKSGGFVTEATLGKIPEIERLNEQMKPKRSTPPAASIKETTKAVKELKDESENIPVVMEEIGRSSEISARVIKDSFGDALESATFDFKNFGNAAGGILDGLARRIARKGFIDPLSGAVDSILFGSGSSAPRPSPDFIGPMPQDGGLLGNIFGGFFADGGRPPMGKVSVVGERGPELFVPDTAGTIIPNGGMGGGVSFTQVINVSPGVPELIRSEINRAAPGIASAAQNGVFMAMEKGGRASQIVGKRS